VDHTSRKAFVLGPYLHTSSAVPYTCQVALEQVGVAVLEAELLELISITMIKGKANNYHA